MNSFPSKSTLQFFRKNPIPQEITDLNNLCVFVCGARTHLWIRKTLISEPGLQQDDTAVLMQRLQFRGGGLMITNSEYCCLVFESSHLSHIYLTVEESLEALLELKCKKLQMVLLLFKEMAKYMEKAYGQTSMVQ